MRNLSIENMEKELNVSATEVLGEKLETAIENNTVEFSAENNEATVFSLWNSHFAC